MKKLLLVISLIALFASMVQCVNAHPGRTDSNGGHTDSSTGEYHYHHGYPAHDHYDMDGDGDVDCPYDFKDKTNHSSNEGSNSNKNTGTNKNTSTNKNTKKNSPDIGIKIYLSLFVLFPVGFLISMPVLLLVSNILSWFKIELCEKGFYILMYTVYFLISGGLIYHIIIW